MSLFFLSGQFSGAKWPIQQRRKPHFWFLIDDDKWSARWTQSRARSSYAEPQPSLAMHLQMHCKGTKKRDANQAFHCFISDLFQMLKWRTKQEQSQLV